MAGSKGDKYYNVFLDYRLWLKTINNEGIMGDGCFSLLIEIKNSGSLKEAAEKAKSEKIEKKSNKGSNKKDQ